VVGNDAAQKAPYHGEKGQPRMIDDTTSRELVKRLARQDRSGARVIERAAILAAGSDSELIVAWILAHRGAARSHDVCRPTGWPPRRTRHGGVLTDSPTRRRYVLPSDALS
jgi:hypothetical protein